MTNKKSLKCANDLGIDEHVIRKISRQKGEPEWMLQLRLKALLIFKSLSIPSWSPDISGLDMNDICYYLKPSKRQGKSWGDVPGSIYHIFNKLGVVKDEQKSLAGLGAQYESEMVYHNLKAEWQEKGVIFVDSTTGLKKYPELFKRYFGSVVVMADNKFAALNAAVWSGGCFIYVPKGVYIEMPLQAYFRIDAEKMGQFERTLIIADQGSQVSYVEGCTALEHNESSLHAAVVEVVALSGARVRYYTIQNWAKNIYNFATKRAVAYKDAVVEWIDCNIGSRLTMKYPGVILKEPGAKADILSIAVSSEKKQIQDTGGKAIHLAPRTSSRIISKNICHHGGQANYRGTVYIAPGAKKSKSFVQCDTLMLDKKSKSYSYPFMNINEKDVEVGHEATIGKLDGECLFYLMSRGISKENAQNIVVNGFIEPLTKSLPMEFAIEMNRLLEIEVGR
jgi:Fe-S cluster assembly protein SufB